MIGASVRSVAVAATVVLLFTVGLLGTGVGGAQNGAFPIEEDFDDETLADWKRYGEAKSGQKVGDNDEPSLLLTPNENDKAGTALYTEKFPTETGVTAEFRYYADEGDGADGISFFFLDAAQVDTDTFDPGSSGGALGYSGSPGVQGGFIGVGFDEYGNFATEAEGGGSGGVGQTSGVTVRGAGDEAEDGDDPYYPHLETTAEDDIAGGAVDGGWRRARITTDPTAGKGGEIAFRIEMSFNGGTSWETVIDSTYSEDEIGTQFPDDFYLGFSGSTGGSTNVHAIDDLSVRQPADITTTVTSGPTAGPYAYGETLEYTFEVSNDGPNEATSLTLEPTTPTGELVDIDWDTDDDGTFEVEDTDSTTIPLGVDKTKTIHLRGTVEPDTSEDLDHEITTALGQGLIDPTPADSAADVSVDLNERPTISGDTRSLDSIAEDETNSDGTTVSDILDSAGTASDPEGETLGVVVDEIDDTDGTWEYSTDGGDTWQSAADALQPDRELLLDERARLRFVPDSDFSGTAELTKILAWDQEKGSSGDTISEITTLGPSTTYSDGGPSATITVADAPEVDSIERVDGTPTSAGSVDFDVTFSKAVDGVDEGDFTLSGGATGDVQEFGPTTASNTVTVTVDSISGDGDLRLDVDDDDSIQDTTNDVPLGGQGTSGSADGSFTGGESYTIDTTPPTTADDTGDPDEDVTGTQLVADVRTNDDDQVSAEGDLTVTKVKGDANNVGNTVDGTNGGRFTVTADGEVTFDADSDFESLNDGDTEQTSVEVTVADEAGNEDTSTVTATVQGVNDDPTGLSIDDTNLLQSAGTDAPVGTLSATDVDNDGAELSYSLVEGAADNEKFGVDDDNLEAQDAATLPDDDYSVRVQVTDANGGTAEETFTITVEDDVEPAIQTVTISDVTDGDGILAAGHEMLIEAKIDEVTAVDTARADVSAFDAGTVELNSAGGTNYDKTVTVGQAPTEGAQSVTVSATDTLGNGGAQAATSNTIVVDLTAPTTERSTAVASEDTDGTQLIADVRTDDDDDVSDQTDLIIAKVEGDANNVGKTVDGINGGRFTVTADGEVTFDADDDFESLNEGETEPTSVAVTVADEAGNTDEKRVEAEVEGVNDDPTGLSIDDTSLLQSAGTDAPVGTLSASDVDNDGAELSYSLVAGDGDGDNGRFVTDGDELRARDAGTLPDGDYEVRVQVADGNGGTAETPFTITVEDDVKPDIKSATVTDATDGNGILAAGDEVLIEAKIDEVTAVDMVTADASAFDAGTVTLTDPNGDDTYDTTVEVGQSPTEGAQSVTVSATDTLNNGGQQAVTSNTIVVDLTAPTTDDTGGSASEDTTGTRLVSDLRTNDEDAISDETDLVVTAVGGTASSVGTPVAGTNGGRFTITTDGRVTFDANGDFETLNDGDTARTSVSVTVADEAGNENIQTVTATVRGVNDDPTGLSLDGGSLLQSAGSDARVGTLSASDIDNNDAALSYSLVSGQGRIDNDRFAVEGTTLLAKNASTMANGDYEVRVQVADTNGGTAERTFTVTVEDDVEPLVKSAAVTDATDGNGILAAGDEMLIEAEVTDVTAVDTVTAAVSAFDAGQRVILPATTGNQYAQTVVVGETPSELAQSVTVSATDTLGNGGTQAIASNSIVVDVTPPILTDEAATVSESTSGTEIVADLRANDADEISASSDLKITAVGGDSAGVDQPVNGTNGGEFTVGSDGRVTFDAAGDFAALSDGDTANTRVEVTVADEAGNEATQTVTVTVEGESDSTTDTRVDFHPPDQGTVPTHTYSITAQNVGGGQQIVIGGQGVTMNPTTPGTAPEATAAIARVTNIRLDQVTLDIGSPTDLAIAISTYDENLRPSAGASGTVDPAVRSAAATFETETGRVAAGYVSVDNRLGGESISQATLRFSVRADYLDGLAVSPTEVTLYHLDDGTWSERETRYLGREDGYHRYAGATPSFSVFALGTTAPSVVVTDARMNRSTVTDNETVTVRVELENRGITDAEPSLAITADGEPLRTLTPRIPGNASRVVTAPIDRPAGTYRLVVGEETVGKVSATPTGPGLRTSGPGATSMFPTPGVVVILVMFALLAVAQRHR